MKLRVFHIDTGRKYFSVPQLKRLLEVMGRHGYTTLELVVGNGGLRFFLDDMTITTATTTYDSETVKAALRTGNRAFCDCGDNELTEAELEDIVSEARRWGVDVQPLLNTPGHMDALVTAMKELGIEGAAYAGSRSTIDLNCAEAVSFTMAFAEKYMAWFAARGSRFFHMGCDEYANDVLTSGFEALKKEGAYDLFTAYVNDMAASVKAYGMIPVMFNDGMYYADDTTGLPLAKDIVCSYWSRGWWGYDLAKPETIAAQGHDFLSTSQVWYYVLGRRDAMEPRPQFTVTDARKGILENPIDGSLPPEAHNLGGMFCLWCDEPRVVYSAEEETYMAELLASYTTVNGRGEMKG